MQQHKPKVDANKIHFREFKILKGQIESPEDYNIDIVDGHEINIGFDLGFNLKENMVKADFSIEIISKSQNAEEARGVFNLLYLFVVDNLNELATLKNNKVEFDLGLGNSLASISHSTTRGILLTRFQGTALQKFILPVINPNELIFPVKENE